MAFKNLKANKRLQNLINGGNDDEFLKKINGEDEPEEKEVTKKKAPKSAPPKKKKKASTTRDRSDVNFEIIKHYFREPIGVNGTWFLELNLISWNGAEPKFDIRKWKYEGDERITSGQAITLTHDELGGMIESVMEEFYDTEDSEDSDEE